MHTHNMIVVVHLLCVLCKDQTFCCIPVSAGISRCVKPQPWVQSSCRCNSDTFNIRRCWIKQLSNLRFRFHYSASQECYCSEAVLPVSLLTLCPTTNNFPLVEFFCFVLVIVPTEEVCWTHWSWLETWGFLFMSVFCKVSASHWLTADPALSYTAVISTTYVEELLFGLLQLSCRCLNYLLLQ